MGNTVEEPELQFFLVVSLLERPSLLLLRLSSSLKTSQRIPKKMRYLLKVLLEWVRLSRPGWPRRRYLSLTTTNRRSWKMLLFSSFSYCVYVAREVLLLQVTFIGCVWKKGLVTTSLDLRTKNFREGDP